MARWEQREARTPFPDSETEQYRGCLDVLILTLQGLRDTRRFFRERAESPYVVATLDVDISTLEARAAHCAHMLFERWVEVKEEPVVARDEVVKALRQVHRELTVGGTALGIASRTALIRARTELLDLLLEVKP